MRAGEGEEGTGSGILSLLDMGFPSLDTSGLGIGTFINNITMDDGEFEFFVQALEQDESVEIISRPRLVLEAGEPESEEDEGDDEDGWTMAGGVKTVEKVPYESSKVVGTTTVQITEFKDTGVTFEATLKDIYDDDYVVLELRAAVKAAGQRLRVALAQEPAGSVLEVPQLFDRSIETTVVVQDRQVLVLGALLSTETSTSRRSVPVLGEIPVLKYLFSSRREREQYRELIFLVKPVIQRGSYLLRPPDLFEERELKAE